MPCPDVPPIDEGCLEGNGGIIHFYSQSPVEADVFSPEGVITESLVENWWLKREYNRAQMFYKLDLICNHLDFHGIPIEFCKFDLGGSDIGRRISGQGTYVNQHIDHQNENRIVQVDVRSFTPREEGPRSYGPLDIQIGGEPGQTVCQMISPGDRVSPGYGVYGVDLADSKPKVNEKARELLLSFLDSKQQQDYRKLGHFGYLEEAAKREWRFYFRYHYPVEFRNPNDGFIGLCIELENETPTEDILLMCLLEVRGGRGDDIIRAGKRNPQPLRDDQILHPGISPTIEQIRELREAFINASISARRFREQIREEGLRIIGLPQQWISEENRETATEARDIAPPLTLEQLHETFLSIAETPRIKKISCSSEAHSDLIERRDIVLNPGISIKLENNNLYFGSLWGIELYVNPDQREPFRPMEG